MGNRILKESICMSAEIDALTWFEEVLFYRLIVTVDDYGIYPADPVLLSHILFPRKESVSRKTLSDALASLEKNRLIRRYSVPGQGDFLILTTWTRHQRLRSSRRKYPGPEEAEAAPTREPETEPGQAESQTAITAEAEPSVITIPLNDGSEFAVTQRDVDEYTALYPAVDVLQELRAMRGWCLNNEKKRKTRSGAGRFVNSWLARAQDRGGSGSPPVAGFASPRLNPYQLMKCEGEIR